MRNEPNDPGIQPREDMIRNNLFKKSCSPVLLSPGLDNRLLHVKLISSQLQNLIFAIADQVQKNDITQSYTVTHFNKKNKD